MSATIRKTRTPVTYTDAEIQALNERVSAVGSFLAAKLTSAEMAKLNKYTRDMAAAASPDDELSAEISAVKDAALANVSAVRTLLLGRLALDAARTALEAGAAALGRTRKTKGDGVTTKIPALRSSLADASCIVDHVLSDGNGEIQAELVGEVLGAYDLAPCISAKSPASAIGLLVEAGVLSSELSPATGHATGNYRVTGVYVDHAGFEAVIAARRESNRAQKEATQSSDESGSETDSAPAAVESAPAKGGRGRKRNAV